MAEKTRILVFGATGVGKTSLCNTLAGRNRATDSGATGVTVKSHVYGKFEDEGKWIELVDTVGLHEADSGSVPTKQAVLQLVELIENSRDGFNLLAHVAKAGRLTQQHQEDYDFFVNRMTDRRIPVVLVLTGCENEQPMVSWVEKNKDHFRQFQYRQLVATCFAEGGNLESHFAPLRVASRQDVLSAIHATSLPKPVHLYGEGTGRTFTQYLSKLWNELVDVTGMPDEYRAKVNESAYEFMRRMGVSKTLADAAVKHLPDLAGEIASKFPAPGSGAMAKMVVRKLLKTLVARK
jgi:GTP-binding protein EngB required for normal cell division